MINYLDTGRRGPHPDLTNTNTNTFPLKRRELSAIGLGRGTQRLPESTWRASSSSFGRRHRDLPNVSDPAKHADPEKLAFTSH